MPEYRPHPAADLFPKLSDVRLNELAENIKAEGLQNPIVLFDGMILDGRNRLAACEIAGIEPRFEQAEADINPWEWVWSQNGERRDLVADQRYLIFAEKNEHSAKWHATKERIASEANAKRSEAAKARERTEDGTFLGRQQVTSDQRYLLHAAKMREDAASAVTTSDATGSTQKTDNRPSELAKASASNTNRGAVARGDKLRKDRPDLAKKVIQGEITSTEAHRQLRKDKIAESIPELPSDKFRVVYADPPWYYGNSGAIGDSDNYGRAERHYPTMKISELCAMDIKNIVEDNAVLFMWVTSPLLGECWPVIKAWGFEYKTSFIWDKVRHNFGHYNSVRHELLLVCTRGSCLPDSKKLHDSVVSLERSNKHSEKPEEFRALIDELYPHGKRIELFARAAAENWEAYGNEAA